MNCADFLMIKDSCTFKIQKDSDSLRKQVILTQALYNSPKILLNYKNSQVIMIRLL